MSCLPQWRSFPRSKWGPSDTALPPNRVAAGLPHLGDVTSSDSRKTEDWVSLVPRNGQGRRPRGQAEMRTVPYETERVLGGLWNEVAPREETTLSRARWKTEHRFIHWASPREL